MGGQGPAQGGDIAAPPGDTDLGQGVTEEIDEALQGRVRYLGDTASIMSLSRLAVVATSSPRMVTTVAFCSSNWEGDGEVSGTSWHLWPPAVAPVPSRGPLCPLL